MECTIYAQKLKTSLRKKEDRKRRLARLDARSRSPHHTSVCGSLAL